LQRSSIYFFRLDSSTFRVTFIRTSISLWKRKKKKRTLHLFPSNFYQFVYCLYLLKNLFSVFFFFSLLKTKTLTNNSNTKIFLPLCHIITQYSNKKKNKIKQNILTNKAICPSQTFKSCNWAPKLPALSLSPSRYNFLLNLMKNMKMIIMLQHHIKKRKKVIVGGGMGLKHFFNLRA
jgi:hypothetical protein